MRLVLLPFVGVLSLVSLVSLTALTGCPEKGGPAEKTNAEPERAEPDDEGKTTTEAKRPAAPVVAPKEKDDDKKPDEDKDKGGW
jgi:hypothetical protein